MATTTNEREATASSSSNPSALSGLRSNPLAVLRRLIGQLKAALDRPLTSYYLLVGASGLLLIIGLIMVLSASSVYSYRANDGDSYAVIRRQVMWVMIGLPFAWLASRINLKLLRSLTWIGLIGSTVLLALTRVPGLGVQVNGNLNWLALGPVQLQPSEMAKLALVLWAAQIYAVKARRLSDWRHVLIPVVPGMLAVTLLVIWGQDLGTALVLFAIMLGMLWVAGAPGRLFIGAISVVAVGAFYLATTSSERRERLFTFVDPFKEYQDAGWQPAHGLYALSSGGIFGKGIGASQQKWGDLPEAHTDFIFAVLGEELGLVGTLLVLSLFMVIAYVAIKVASRTEDDFIRFASFGIVIWLMSQTLINVGMVLTLLPVIGIPLPLVSYGGSALVPSLIALGLLIGFARRDPEAAQALAARKRRRSAGLSATTPRGQ